MKQRSTATSQAGNRRPRNPQIIDEQPGPVVPAGHSYGGAVITEAASHEKVAALG